jgi:hypothetical protein
MSLPRILPTRSYSSIPSIAPQALMSPRDPRHEWFGCWRWGKIHLRSVILTEICAMVFSAFVFGASTPGSQDNQNSAPPAAAMPSEMQMVNIPYFSEKDGMYSILTLNNNASKEMSVSIAVYDREGQVSTTKVVTLRSHTITNFPIAELMKDARIRADSGNIELTYDGESMGVTAQVGVLAKEGGISFESREVDMMDLLSSKLNGLVWLPDARYDAFLALTNVTSSQVSINLTPRTGEGKLVLKPRETRVLNLSADQKSNDSAHGGLSVDVADDTAHARSILVMLEHDGQAGAVIATGFVINRGNGYSTNFELVDPATSKSQKVAGTHVRFGQWNAAEGLPNGLYFSAPLLIGNTGSTTTNAHVFLEYTQGGHAGRIHVDDISVEAASVKEFDLADKMAHTAVSAGVDDAGIDITYDSAPGTLLAALTSVDQSGDFSFEVPVKDPLESMGMAQNSYPWTLEGGANTLLHLKNTTDKAVWAVVQFRFADGGTYNPDRVHLEPFQTISLNTQQIVASKTLDVQKKPFPPSQLQGQLVWEEETPGSMIGRAEQVNVRARTARSFSCSSSCPCPNTVNAPTMSPAYYNGIIGDSGSFLSPTYTQSDCQGTQYGPYTASVSNWTSSDTSVATVNQSAWISLTGAGTSTIAATGQSITWYYAGPARGCLSTPHSANDNAPLTVTKLQYQVGSTWYDVSGTLYVLNGTTVTFGIDPVGVSANWSGSSGASGSGNTNSVAFNNTSSSTSDFKTVVATVGSAQPTANVIVYDVIPVFTPQDNFVGRSTTSVGIGEIVNLSVTLNPGISVSQAGSLTWESQSGNGSVTGINSTNGTATYTAPFGSEADVLDVRVGPGTPSQNMTKTVSTNVITPSNLYHVRDPIHGITHTHGDWECGELRLAYLQPQTVSFATIIFREGTAVATATGFLAGMNGNVHLVGPDVTIGTCNVTTGCAVLGADDEVYSGQRGPQFSAGTFDWNIPQQWRQQNTTTYTTFVTLDQHHTADSSGTAVISKGGESHTCYASDPTTYY